ncbi:transketolase-like TK C-terminal-containing protein [Microbacterium gubbeenense]|uniref:transketolase-like TK C-terminal-containing protein n=1 Tax=Microbacterium gubbeenense TaxID=159896 RepID=UPI003F94AA08
MGKFISSVDFEDPLPRVSVEAASGASWREIVGDRGEIVSIDEFGLSAPADQAMAARAIPTATSSAPFRRASPT